MKIELQASNPGVTQYGRLIVKPPRSTVMDPESTNLDDIKFLVLIASFFVLMQMIVEASMKVLLNPQQITYTYTLIPSLYISIFQRAKIKKRETEDVILLKRSNSCVVEVKKSNGFWRIGKLFKKKREKKGYRERNRDGFDDETEI
ncbi:hypothetical protein L6452_23359 [Arctium lappa]|uniref:Uncharacterized protein n=1 Tax=Arctium lappa TaxID=4217 RepID=A0ACB9B1G4_ARCLA|nr:hypothetical protein L6452_23359 [Arctium lappa]